mgnify:CR=1 FL=1
MLLIQILSILGFLLSLYFFKVEFRLYHDKNYKATCDVNKKISCSKALLSKYNGILGIPNSLAGIFYYIILFSLAAYNIKFYIFPLVLLAFIGSIFLAYFSIIKLKTYCLVCNLIYLINLILFLSLII